MALILIKLLLAESERLRGSVAARLRIAMDPFFVVVFVFVFFVLFVFVVVLVFTVLLVVGHVAIEPLLFLVKYAKHLLNLLIVEVLFREPDLALKDGRVLLVQIRKDFDQVQAGSLAQPVQMLLSFKLGLQVLDIPVACLAQVVWSRTQLGQSLVQFLQVVFHRLNLLVDVTLTRRCLHLSDGPLQLEQLGVNRLSLWLLTCVD